MILRIFTEPWHWAVSGAMIGLVMLTVTYFGKSFGLSSTYRALCSVAGAGRLSTFFNVDWKNQRWNLVFVAGVVLGGWISARFLTLDYQPNLNPKTLRYLELIGIMENTSGHPVTGFAPDRIFSLAALHDDRILILLMLGGLLSGFGSRYAGGCTSGHFITGIAHLQWPSVVTIIFFMIGGVMMTNYFLPWLLR